jgi:FkbM family methyltransferase
MATDARQIPADWIGSWAGSLAYLAAAGLPFRTFIDVGCAEGYHSLLLWHGSLLRDKTIINVDANPLFGPSLAKIQEAVGGDYRICAIADRSGMIDLYSSAHPYWASAAEPGDAYWASVNDQLGDKTPVPCLTLDALLDEVACEPPYVLKLDVQGFEARALRGGARMLRQAAVVVCEAFSPGFAEIHAVLQEAGFSLFDITNLHRAEDGRLGWFDAVYLHADHAGLNSGAIWARERNEAVRQAQVERQRAVEGWVDQLVSHGKSGRA